MAEIRRAVRADQISGPTKTFAKRVYTAPVIRKDQQLDRVTGLGNLTGQQA